MKRERKKLFIIGRMSEEGRVYISGFARNSTEEFIEWMKYIPSSAKAKIYELLPIPSKRRRKK